jgi:hypothetical protein
MQLLMLGCLGASLHMLLMCGPGCTGCSCGEQVQGRRDTYSNMGSCCGGFRCRCDPQAVRVASSPAQQFLCKLRATEGITYAE